jgi:hypothetical protein
MDRYTLKEILRSLNQKCQAELDEIRSRFKVSFIEWIGLGYYSGSWEWWIMGIRK